MMTPPRRAIHWIAVALLCFLLSLPALAQQPQAQVDRQTLAQGDVLTLSIVLEGNNPGQPDFSPLMREFDLLGNRTSTQVQIINGRNTIQRRWEVDLAPRSSGELEIPPISVGGTQTQAIRITVTDSPPATTSTEDLLVEVELDTGSGDPYVQAQILYTVRLRYGIPLLEGMLTDPQPERALVQRLGDDRSYRTTVDGRQYAVIERQYAIFPEASGELHIPPVRFQGRVATTPSQRSRRSSAFDSLFDRGQRVHASSSASTLQVQPRPADWQGAWLPARQLWLRDIWHTEPTQAQVGEPLQLSLLLEAEGLSAAHLPELALAEIPGVQVYPEPVQTQDQQADGWLRGRQARTFTLIPTQAGTVEIPALEIPWWDVNSGERRVVSIPSRQFQVAPVVGEAPAPLVNTTPTAPALDASPEASPRGFSAPVSPGWLYGLLSLTAVVLVLSLLSRRGFRSEKNPRRELRSYCRRGLARPAAQALLAWGAQRWPQAAPRNLGELATRLEASQAQQVRQLELSLYAAGESHWEGAALWSALAGGLREPSPVAPRQDQELAPLYPRLAVAQV